MHTRRDFLKAAGIAAATVSMPTSLINAASATGIPQNAPSGHPSDIQGSNSLRSHAEARGFLVGCAVVPQRFGSEAIYASTVAGQANILVAENAMKWAALRPAPDKFDFAAADELLAFAQMHGQKLRGHNLCWHESIPGWFHATVNKDNARQFLTEHIQTVAGRYAGKIHSWDVVNEAIDIKSGRSDGLRNTPWLEFLGPGYLDLAYRTARQADPHALLTYNDYGIETDTPDAVAKREQLLNLVRGFKKRGVPIDAVGVQSHLSATDPLPGEGLRKFVRELRQMGLQVFVTEMDVNESKLAGTIEERDVVIGNIYKSYATLMLAEPNVTALLTWGITDRYTWLNGAKWARPDKQPQRSLPLDADYRPTPSFFALRDALDARKSHTGRNA
jgi:endo-1,4-beta-xylanase